MFDQLVDGVRKASESSLQMQQELFRQWTRLLASSSPNAAGAASDQTRTAQRRAVELVVEMLNKHRETIDSTYRSGIQIIEQTFHVTEAKSTDDYRRLTEDLWRKLFDLQKEQAENQSRDFQTWFERTAGMVQDVPRA